MKKAFACFVVFGLLMSSPIAYAESVKIGYFNVKRILNDSKRGTKDREAFTKRANELKKRVDKKQEELKAMKESLEKKAGMLSEQALRQKEKEYQQNLKELERLAQDSNAELKQIENEMLNRLMISLSKVVRKLGEDGNYTLIMEVSSVAYAPKEIDITDQVIKALDAAKE